MTLKLGEKQFYFQRLTQEANLSAILIITDMTICFVAHGAINYCDVRPPLAW